MNYFQYCGHCTPAVLSNELLKFCYNHSYAVVNDLNIHDEYNHYLIKILVSSESSPKVRN